MSPDQLQSLYDKHGTISGVARDLGVSNPTARKYLHENGVETVLVPQLIDIDISQYVYQGMNNRQIANLLNISLSCVWTLVNRQNLNGIRNHPLVVPDNKTLENDYKVMTFVDMGKKYGVSNVTAKKWCKNAGISLRSHSEVHKQFVIQRVAKTKQDKYGYAHFPENIQYSKEEQNLLDTINSYGFNFKSTKKVLDNHYELDGYDETLKVAIEYCGLYWHNEGSPKPRKRSYHYSKYKECAAKGIRLFTIFEDEWLTRKDQVLWFILNTLGYHETKIYARKCEVKQVDKRLADDFCQEYHIQGSPGRIRYSYGLFHGEDLVGVVTFSEHHRGKDILTLNRVCFKRGYHIPGGASKLIKYAINDMNVTEFITWSDNRWSNGNLYETLGFIKDCVLPPDYSYVGKSRRHSKQSMTKKKIGATDEQTESEKAAELGYFRIWDCGKIRWRFTK